MSRLRNVTDIRSWMKLDTPGPAAAAGQSEYLQYHNGVHVLRAADVYHRTNVITNIGR